MTLALLLAVAIGVALGLLGGGGSIITVPVLVYAANVPAQAAVAMSLAIVGATSAVGGFVKWREGLVHGRASFLFASTGMAGALAGAQLTPRVDPSVLLLIFAALMLIVAVKMLAQKNEKVPTEAQCRPWRCASAGTGVGFMTGFLGVGGGFLIVPALTYFGQIPIRIASGTSLLVISVNSLAGLAGHLGHGAVDWKLTGVFLVMALVGMAAGVNLAARLSKESLSRWFAWFVIAVAIYVVAKNRQVFLN